MNILNDFIKFIQEQLQPTKIYSWQTLMLMSGFSLIVALLTQDLIQRVILYGGWIFLILGVSWWSKENNVIMGPWMTGLVVCAGSLLIFPMIKWQSTLVFIPIISAFIAAIPIFFNQNLDFQIPSASERQILVFLFGSQLFISCWIQFGFVLQTWLQQYPTLMALDVSQSLFISKVEIRSFPPQGTVILDRIEPLLIQKLADKPWSDTERWLLEEGRSERLRHLLKKATEQENWDLFLKFEGRFWALQTSATARNPGYDLQLRAIWQGPGRLSSPEKYGEKICRITPIFPAGVTTVTCTQITFSGWSN